MRPLYCNSAAGRTPRRSEAGCPRLEELAPCNRFGSLVTATTFMRVGVHVCLTAQAVMRLAVVSLEG